MDASTTTLASIHLGDCLDVLQSMQPGSIDLVYLDPPFFTKAKHRMKNRERTAEFSFDDRWHSNQEYVAFLKDRLIKMRRVMKDTASIFVHCDRRASHHIRILLDHVFGEQNFRSEIIWHYKRWSNSKKGLLPAHQNIYFYSKSGEFKFNTVFMPYSEATNIDQILQERTRDAHNKSVYKVGENGQPVIAGKKQGVPLCDVWDMPYLNPKAKERSGYPTQKPLLLLERIIEISTDEGDTVLDPFCGSGTTCVAAKLMNRSYIGIDISEDAVSLSEERLATPIKTESNLLEKGRDTYQTADVDALRLLDGLQFNPVQRNKGIDAILVQQFQGTPILVRIQRKTESIHQAAHYLNEAMKKKQSLKSFLIRTHANDLIEPDIEYENITIIDAPSLKLSGLI